MNYFTIVFSLILMFTNYWFPYCMMALCIVPKQCLPHEAKKTPAPNNFETSTPTPVNTPKTSK